jgi:hypothetical protein
VRAGQDLSIGATHADLQHTYPGVPRTRRRIGNLGDLRRPVLAGVNHDSTHALSPEHLID